MRLVWAEVVQVESAREGMQRLSVALDDGSAGSALLYTDLCPVCEVGDRVLLNSTAVELGLGTGGLHFVVARAGSGTVMQSPSGGHVMKARYTPLQRDVLAVEEMASPHADVMASAVSVDGMPVVCCGLHSQVLPVAASIKEMDPGLRVVYVMTDGASLPIALSELVPSMIAVGLVDQTITSGQSFGGALEAVTLHSALIAARHVAQADVAVVALGPGITGTATPFGHGGIAQGEAINAAAAVGGRPVAVLRLSFADARQRHYGVSHHSISALTAVALARAIVAVPDLGGTQAAEVDRALHEAGVWDRHEREDVTTGSLPDTRGVEMRSMGRTSADDPAFYHAAAAAGKVAARILLG